MRARGLCVSISPLLALVMTAASLDALPAGAEEPDLDWAYALAHEVMSPFCPGRTLAECPSPQAAELRLWILSQAAAGATEPEIFNMLIERYGDEVRGTPKAEGWGLSAYLLPIFFFVLGAPVVVFILRRMSHQEDGIAGASRVSAQVLRSRTGTRIGARARRALIQCR